MHVQAIVDGGGCTFEGSSVLGRGAIRRDDMWRELVEERNVRLEKNVRCRINFSTESSYERKGKDHLQKRIFDFNSSSFLSHATSHLVRHLVRKIRILFEIM